MGDCGVCGGVDGDDGDDVDGDDVDGDDVDGGDVDVDVDGGDGGDGTWTSGQEGSSMTSPAFAASAPGFDEHQHN